MFSGIVAGLAQIVSLNKKKDTAELQIKFPHNFLQQIKQGGSIAINGVCLSLKNKDKNQASFDLILETLTKTNLGELQKGDAVNIERSLKLGDEIGGHLLSGHIFTTVSFDFFEQTKKLHYFNIDKKIAPYIFYKGFVALNGVSLTVADVTKKNFAVGIIPDTLEKTNLSQLKNNSKLNLEIDNQTQIIVDSLKKAKKTN